MTPMSAVDGLQENRRCDGVEGIRWKMGGNGPIRRIRTAAAAIAIGAAVCAGAQGDTVLPELYVFCPLTLRPQAVQQRLRDACTGIDVVVFGRREDFLAGVQSSAPAGVLVNPHLGGELAGYHTVLRGTRQRSTEEPYVLIRITSEQQRAHAQQNTVGMVDFVGRERMQALADSVLGDGLSVKRVVKVEDLLPLLRFGIAEMAFVPIRHCRHLKATSKLDFQVKTVPGVRMGIVSLAVREGAAADDLIVAIRDAGESVLDVFELDGWQ